LRHDRNRRGERSSEGTTVDELARLNNNKDKKTIHVAQKLVVPAK
jgi:LysM repeat protein